ncbi:MAG: hypothetical protein AABM67_00460 [Acidobacteriota bacterium]
MSTVNQLLEKLESAKRSYGSPQTSVLIRALSDLERRPIKDVASLIRFHENLLFLRAYPHNSRVLKKVDSVLKLFGERITKLRKAEADLSPMDDVEVSGIAGTSVTSNFSYALVRWLVAKYPKQLSIDWDWFEEEERFGTTARRFLPLLEEDAMVEAHVPYREWLRAATGKLNELAWLVERFEDLELSDRAKAELYDSLKLHVTWQFGPPASRTRMRLSGRRVFYHDRPLIQRREISLASELNSPPIPVQRISRTEGQKILDLSRETSAVRYRELHGFTYGDPNRVLKANIGRGTEIFVMGVPPEHRLPLRAYHAVLVFKNGVPVAYFEGLSVFERMESGFNLYYTFREGETAWLYARILRLMRQLLGVTVFSIDPYQVGHENEEGIESGAFWFYRKLGFRPVRPELIKLTLSEERRLAADPRRRTSPSTLRKLAAGHMLFEMPVSQPRAPRSDWDRFEGRNVGLAVQRRIAREFHSDPQKFRTQSVEFLKSKLGIETRRWSDAALSVLESLGLVFATVPGMRDWSDGEKELAVRIIQAKASHSEAVYLKLMQKHARLRAAIIRLGS